jgi:hypothetical protein
MSLVCSQVPGNGERVSRTQAHQLPRRALEPTRTRKGHSAATQAKTTDPTYDVINHFCCDHCSASLSVQFVTKLAPNDVYTTLIEKHLLQNPNCRSLDKLKRECIFPEFFLPDNRHSDSTRTDQAALRDRVNRLTKFMKSLQGKPEFTVMPPPGDPAVHIFSPWTDTTSNFDEVCWNSIVPSWRTYVLA